MAGIRYVKGFAEEGKKAEKVGNSNLRIEHQTGRDFSESKLPPSAGMGESSLDHEARRKGSGGGVFEGGGEGRAECAEGGDESGVAAWAHGDPGGGAGGADAGGEPFEGTGAVVGGIGAKGKEGEDAGGGGEVEGAESEGKEESGDEE